ncbi:hypothetical protein NL108_014259, partial [Boleophthalmus pectinirostris]
FQARYEQGHLLGSGGCGSVYAGVRKSDGLPVAIKYVPKKTVDYYPLVSCGRMYHIPKEVYIMYRATAGADRVGQCAAVSLLDWFILGTDIIIVMERPNPCTDLMSYSLLHDPLPENTVRDIMNQLVLAVKDLQQKRVFHRDLKLENILIQETEGGVRVRIIDFGCGCTVMVPPYTSYSGTPKFCPPEFFLNRRYRDGPTSVWQLGTIAFELLNGDGSDFNIFEWFGGKLSMKTISASQEGKDFIQVCLEADPSRRISLEELEEHMWFHCSPLS